MQKAIMASFCHVSSSKTNAWHDNCPTGSDSWRGYQRDKANNTVVYKPSPGLPGDVVREIKPIFVDLCKADLLKKCLDVQTQNHNESFNGTVWNRIPKTVYSGADQFQFGLYDAVAHFNIGRLSTIKIFETLSMKPGKYMRRGKTNKCIAQNNRRLYFTRENQLYSNSHPSAQTPGLSNNIEAVAENISKQTVLKNGS